MRCEKWCDVMCVLCILYIFCTWILCACVSVVCSLFLGCVCVCMCKLVHFYLTTFHFLFLVSPTLMYSQWKRKRDREGEKERDEMRGTTTTSVKCLTGSMCLVETGTMKTKLPFLQFSWLDLNFCFPFFRPSVSNSQSCSLSCSSGKREGRERV